MKLAFVFPGQGSQSVGMMNGYSELPEIQQTFLEASEILHQDIWSLVNNGPAEELNQTLNTQPVMLAAGVAIYRAWINLCGFKPQILAGHSLGEYTALVASEVLDFKDAIALVRFRAQSMQQAVPEGVGAMAAILGLEEDVLTTLCKEVTHQTNDEIVEVANLNSPGQIVIAGHKNAVQKAIEMSQSRGAKRAILLPVSIPSHCSLMQSAVEKMQSQLAQKTFNEPKLPILHNADVASHVDTESIKNILTQQLVKPVRWIDTIHSFANQGITHVIECGPGKVLMGLNKRIEPNLQHLSLYDKKSIEQAIEVLK
ncbi:MAG TPA: ACP S-malonyltransferase [Nitrosomonas sp.]|nr:ACP S-malonyltransferase [Nitrosomonas sp.]HQX13320.1 ACP S-malonyltransferase [Nitrosomonas sp.]HRB21183.1 ACP S-malonyltransferase [Nitrosomonas sp.]HRB31769.1 ACP S-malonyltransferase [Nitrosomonas sp.]HRB44391.1 ACP S-malonyltransferase [Nitrosomonas sp.]